MWKTFGYKSSFLLSPVDHDFIQPLCSRYSTISRAKILYSQRDEHPFKCTVTENDHSYEPFFYWQSDVTHTDTEHTKEQ